MNNIKIMNDKNNNMQTKINIFSNNVQRSIEAAHEIYVFILILFYIYYYYCLKQ